MIIVVVFFSGIDISVSGVLILYVFVKIQCSYFCFVCIVLDFLFDNVFVIDFGEEWVVVIDVFCEVWMYRF